MTFVDTVHLMMIRFQFEFFLIKNPMRKMGGAGERQKFVHCILTSLGRWSIFSIFGQH